MGVLQIPESIQVGLRLLQGLEQPVVEQLYAALGAEPPRGGVADLVDSISTKVRAVPKDDLTKLVLALLGLHSGLRITKLSQEEFLQALADSEEFAIADDQKPAFKHRLKQGLELPSLAITSK